MFEINYITMRDSEILKWIHDRLQYLYHESPNSDYMIRLAQIIANLKEYEE